MRQVHPSSSLQDARDERGRRRLFSIRVKLIALSMLLLVVVIGLFGVINGMHAMRIIDDSSERLADTIVRGLRQAGTAKFQLLSGTARISLVQGDYSTLQAVVQDLRRKDELVTEAAVMDSTGRVLAHSDPAQVGERATGILHDVLSVRKEEVRPRVVVSGRRSIVFVAPVKYQDLRVWIVFMAYSLRPLEAELARAETRRRAESRASLNNTLLVGGLAVLLGLLMAVFQGLRITRPIKALVRQADQIAGGDLMARVEVQTNDEIGLLGDRFNFMTGRVRTLLREVQEKAAVEREVEVASALQSTLVPESSAVELPGIELAGFFRPAAKCGGDWWSYYELVEDRVLVVIGDVTGHGLPSAMITAVVKGAASNMVSVTEGRLTPDALLQELHGAVLQTARGRFAMTCFASIYEPGTRALRYANAGHTFPYLLRGEEGRWLEVRGSLLGDEGCCSFQTGETQLDPDDLLVWYTDGVVEGQAPGGEPFGYQRLTASIRANVTLPADGVRDRIVSEMYRHFSDVAQEDDITLVVGKVG